MKIRQFAWVTLLTAALLQTGCGFALRGTTAATPIPLDHQQVSLILQDDALTFALKRPLQQNLQLSGIQDTDDANNHIKVQNLRFRRYELVGTLTEVRLVLMADVSYQIQHDGQTKTQTTPLQVERSYQYNEASVATLDQQGDKAKAWLYDNLAQRIAEQYRLLTIRP